MGTVCTWDEDKIWHGQISLKDNIKHIIWHYLVCDRPTQSMQIMYIDSLGNTITPILISNTSRERKTCLQTVLSRLRCLGINEDNNPGKPGYEYGKQTFDTNENTVWSVDSNQNVNNEFQMDSIKYYLHEKGLTNLQSQRTDAHTVHTNCSSHVYKLDPTKIKQLQQKDMHISKLSDKCKTEKITKHPITKMNMVLPIGKLGMPQIFSHNYGP